LTQSTNISSRSVMGPMVSFAVQQTKK